MKGRKVCTLVSLAIILYILGSVGGAYADNGVSPTVTKWVDALPIPPVAATSANPLYPRGDYYEISMTAHQHQFHSELGQATVWTYGQGGTSVYLGPTIVAKKNRPVVVKWINLLPTDINDFPLKDSIDPTIMGADLPAGRAIPHLHGGHSAAEYDGTPDQWWTKDFGATGIDFVTDTFNYTNDQPATLLWYHDHAMAITRMNPYLGLAAAYVLLDNIDNGTTINGFRVPSGYGKYHIPVVLQDKTFNDDGSLWYPTVGNNPVRPIWVPEFFGDTAVINGKAYPYLDAQPRRYRFRFLNGSQARFYNIHFNLDGTDLPFWVIGSEGGLLPAPKAKTSLKIGPGERFDVIADFTGVPLESNIILTNDNPAPDPDGSDPMLPELMQIRINTPVPAGDPDRSTPPARLRLPAVPRLLATPRLPKREIVLKENMYEGPEDPNFPDAIDTPTEVLLNGYHFMEPTADFVKAGTTEDWEWINLTGDTHPMHIHLTMFQVLNRQAIDAEAYAEDWQEYLDSGRNPLLKPILKNYLINGAYPPDPEESGYKDTVKAYPGYVTRVRAKFVLPSTSSVKMIDGHRSYGKWVYHCHILEHEENDMMRPFEVVP